MLHARIVKPFRTKSHFSRGSGFPIDRSIDCGLHASFKPETAQSLFEFFFLLTQEVSTLHFGRSNIESRAHVPVGKELKMKMTNFLTAGRIKDC
ncbi:hypothetical protein MVEN_00496800 [Mycena venus]|uniref:Uncharacterized protein n=1 Tax=Mycena venus TaxID=2733690 RepID=A0A8H6YVX2_9AGAR|nr:hypothetical protein MVEN_00496800 [Mycena venus]